MLWSWENLIYRHVGRHVIPFSKFGAGAFCVCEIKGAYNTDLIFSL